MNEYSGPSTSRFDHFLSYVSHISTKKEIQNVCGIVKINNYKSEN